MTQYRSLYCHPKLQKAAAQQQQQQLQGRLLWMGQGSTLQHLSTSSSCSSSMASGSKAVLRHSAAGKQLHCVGSRRQQQRRLRRLQRRWQQWQQPRRPLQQLQQQGDSRLLLLV
jgi:hypothetical protein